MKVNLIKGDKVSDKTDYRDSLPVNMYAVERPMYGAAGYMLCYPGLTSIATGEGVDRGGFYNDRQEALFRVSGANLVKVNTNGTVDVLGGVSGSSQASMAYSFNTQAVVADGKFYLYGGSSGFRQVTDADVGSPLDIVWVDGYYFMTDGEYLFHTDITNEETIDALQFGTAEFMPDGSLGLGKTQDNKVIVFGRYSTEYFINAATDDFAFQRVATRAQKVGIVATHAKCESGGAWYIAGGRREEPVGIHRLGLGSTEKISTREIDKVLAQYTEPELADIRLESVTLDGTTIIIVHLPEETLCFNETTAKKIGPDSSWSILKTDVKGDDTYRAINGVFDAKRGQWVYGDKRDGTIGRLDNEVFTHYDEMVEWIIYTPFILLETTSIDEIEIETIPGNTVDLDATVAVSMTYNGLTYGTEWFQMYGLPLDYSQRFILRRLGYVRDWVGFKLRGATRSRMAFHSLDVRNA